MTDAFEGHWRLVDSRGWDSAGAALPAPYGKNPMGEITFSGGRMLAAVCNGDTEAPPAGRGFSSYGGAYSFDGQTLTVAVDIASDPRRIGSQQVRGVSIHGNFMVLRPPRRAYGETAQQRELLWERVWNPSSDEVRARHIAREAASWEPSVD